jgi:hypothetical protein
MKKLITMSVGAIVGVFLAVSMSAIAGQGPLGVNAAANTSGYYAPMNLDANGSLYVMDGGSLSRLNMSASAVVKATPGVVVRVSVTTAGSAPGSVYDTTSTGTAAAANLIGSIPNTVGIYYFDWPTANGIVVAPGTGQVVSVSYR